MTTPYWFGQVYFYIAIALYVIGWLGSVVYYALDEEDFIDVAMMSFLSLLIGAFIAAAWPIALVFSGIYFGVRHLKKKKDTAFYSRRSNW